MENKKIYTSYFAKLKNIDITKYKPYAISRYLPKGINVNQIIELAPTSHLLKKWKDNKIDWEEYSEEYCWGLESINLEKVFESIPNNSILLCYEKNYKQCHRDLLSQYINNMEDINIKIQEYI